MVVVEAWNSKGMPPRVNLKLGSPRYTLKSIDYPDKCLYALLKKTITCTTNIQGGPKIEQWGTVCVATGSWKHIEDNLTTHWLQDLCSFHFREHKSASECRASRSRFPEFIWPDWNVHASCMDSHVVMWKLIMMSAVNCSNLCISIGFACTQPWRWRL